MASSFASTSSFRRPKHVSPSWSASRRQFCRSRPVFALSHYETLNLPKTATRQQIKSQFYRLSKEYHPDVKPGNQAKFQAISEAYATLGHADSRRAYDSSMAASSSHASGGRHYRPGYASHPSAGAYGYGYGYQEPETGPHRRARADYAWENTKRTDPKYTYAPKQNPFTSSTSASGESFTAHNDFFDRMQARAAWRAANLSAGARKRMAQDTHNIEREENLRNTSGIGRAIQVVAIFFGVLWLTGGLRASALEQDLGHETDDEQRD